MIPVREKSIHTLFLVGLLLLLCSCASISEEDPTGKKEEDGIVVAASFHQEDGAALQDRTIRFSFGENNTDRQLNNHGELKVSGLPRSGDTLLTILNLQDQVQGTMPLLFSEGAVIDATTDESGTGHITVRKDTEEVALVFILKNDGTLQCTLQLAQLDLSDSDSS